MKQRSWCIGIHEVPVEDVVKAKTLGITYELAYNRVYHLGWKLERAITTPVRTKQHHKLIQLAEQNGISRELFLQRIRKSRWDEYKAATHPIMTHKECGQCKYKEKREQNANVRRAL